MRPRKVFDETPAKRRVKIVGDFSFGVKLEPVKHIYYRGEERFTPVSKVIEKFKSEFNRDYMLPLSAGKSFREKYDREPTPEELKQEVELLGKDWDHKAENSQVYGTDVHAALEEHDKTGYVNPMYQKLINSKIQTIKTLGDYKMYFPESVIVSEKYKVAGTSDRPSLLYGNVMDMYDYKTNVEKGIQFRNKYKKRMTNGLEHLECCNYNHYALQLSIYSLILELEHNCQTGRLGILFCNKMQKMFYIPVNYMKFEAMYMLENYHKF